jgi:hypothetical protein
MASYSYYQHLRELLEYRGYNLIDVKYTYEQFMKSMRKDKGPNYVLVNAMPSDRIKAFRKSMLTAVLITNECKPAEINKLREALRKNKVDQLFVIDVGEKGTEGGKKVESWYEETVNYIYVEENKGINAQCDVHRVVPPAERLKLKFHGGINKFILPLDMMNVWAGGRHGDLIEIQTTSELSHQPFDYRSVI